jgi:hypothetical protein
MFFCVWTSPMRTHTNTRIDIIDGTSTVFWSVNGSETHITHTHETNRSSYVHGPALLSVYMLFFFFTNVVLVRFSYMPSLCLYACAYHHPPAQGKRTGFMSLTCVWAWVRRFTKNVWIRSTLHIHWKHACKHVVVCIYVCMYVCMYVCVALSTILCISDARVCVNASIMHAHAHGAAL